MAPAPSVRAGRLSICALFDVSDQCRHAGGVGAWLRLISATTAPRRGKQQSGQARRMLTSTSFRGSKPVGPALSWSMRLYSRRSREVELSRPLIAIDVVLVDCPASRGGGSGNPIETSPEECLRDATSTVNSHDSIRRVPGLARRDRAETSALILLR